MKPITDHPDENWYAPLEASHTDESEASAQHIRHLEERYHFEDIILDAISHANAAKALDAIERISDFPPASRTEDDLRDRKNLLITLNSLMRRTAYEAGVHPYYIDTISANYAILIERCSVSEDLLDIIPYMVRSYCNLVEKRNLSAYSEPIRQILVTVDSSLDSNLSLKRFAGELFLNTSHLSNLFKKEVGMTLTDYVNKSRLTYAKKLLKGTDFSIQDIAVRSGIPDVHYFTRLFTRECGMAPREWRKHNR